MKYPKHAYGIHTHAINHFSSDHRPWKLRLTPECIPTKPCGGGGTNPGWKLPENLIGFTTGTWLWCSTGAGT